MSPEAQTVGLGVYILSTIWLLTLVLCIISVRTGQLIGAIAFIISLLITIVLILIPRVSETHSVTSEKVYDPLFVLRYCLLAFLVVCISGGVGAFIVYHCMPPVQTKKLRHWIQ